MLATEHADRFTVALPNGGTMDVFKADLRPETAAELRSMVVPGMARGGRVDDDPSDPTRFGRKGTENAKRAKQDELDTLEDQLAGLEAIAQEEEYADVPTEGESEAMAAGAEEQRRARAEGDARGTDAALRIAREGATIAEDAELAAERERAAAGSAARRQRAADTLAFRSAAQEGALIAEDDERAAAVMDEVRAREANIALGRGEADAAWASREAAGTPEAIEARRIREANAANPSWSAGPSVGMYQPDVAGGSGNRSDAYLTDERADYDPLGRIIPAVKGAVGALGEFAQDIGLVRPAGAGSQAALSAFGRGAPPTDTSLSPEEQAMARRTMDAPAAPPAAAPVDPDAEWKAKFGAFMRESSSQRVPQISGGVGKQTMEPFAAPKGYLDAVAEQQRVNNDLASFDQRAAADRIALEEAQAIERQRVIDDLAMQRASEQRRLDQMREEAFNGKIDANRAFDRMDNGQRALSLIGLILGGIGAGNTGVNAAVGVMERMIDRDIDAQAKDLGRKQTAYSEAIRQGYQAEQARQMAKAEAFSLLDGAIARAAMKSNSERGILNAQAINAELGVRRETTLASLQDAHEGRQLQRMGLDQQRQIANMQMRQAAENAALQRKATLLAAMNKSGALEHTLPNGQVVVASDATAKAKLAEAQRAHVNFVNGLAKIENFRKQSGKAWMPEWAAVFGFDEAEQAQAAQSLAGAVQLAFLKAQGAGAYDKGSGELANKIIPNPGNITTPDDSLFAKTANLRDMANADFLSTVTANTRGGRVYGWTGGEPIGAD